MNQTAATQLPALIVVAGPPGAGKTTLAHALARAIRCPVISRDEIREGLVNTVGSTGAAGDDLALRANGAFFDTLALLLDRRVSVVAEAAFQHKLWAPRLDPLLAIARVRIVVCEVDPDLARTRGIARHEADPDRRRFHPDPAVQTSPGLGPRDAGRRSYDPPRFAVPTLTVNTADGYDPVFAAIVEFARA